MMVLGHVWAWWLRSEDFWLIHIIALFLEDFLAGGFLITAGVSATLSFKSGIIKAEKSSEYSKAQVKNEYKFRALLILGLALTYNSAVAIGTLNPLNIWKWFIPLTIAISLFLYYPLLKASIWLKILIAIVIWITNYCLVSFLSPFRGEISVFGAVFHILYHSLDLHPLLFYFSYFLIGTVMGDILFGLYKIENQQERRAALNRRLVYPSLIIGLCLTTIGIFYLFPDFLIHSAVSKLLYSLGLNLLVIPILLTLEEYEIVKPKKSYRFFQYFSYYSLTVYIGHNPLYFLFFRQLTVFSIWFVFAGTIFFIVLLLRTFYDSNWRNIISIKVQIGKLAVKMAKRVEERNNMKNIEEVNHYERDISASKSY
jgi:hypothetical protein